jgi:hypothetical protein
VATSENQPTQPLGEGAGEPRKTWADPIKTVGGLTAVAVGIVAVMAIAITALIVGGTTAATIATSTSGVIASIVGAYFGVKVGTDQTRNAVEGERKQAAKAAVYAAHLPPAEADRVLGMAETVARGTVREGPAPGPRGPR